MPEPRRRMQQRVFGSGVASAVPDPRGALDLKPYRYRGRDTEPDPREIARQVRAEIAARRAAGSHE